MATILVTIGSDFFTIFFNFSLSADTQYQFQMFSLVIRQLYTVQSHHPDKPSTPGQRAQSFQCYCL